MPWLIQHKCTITQPESSEYAVLRGEREGLPVSQVRCLNDECREEFYILGHEMFNEAIPDNPRMPPGFLIARSRKS
jgi:hypothetical protein